MASGDLDAVYSAGSVAEIRQAYEDWSAKYDADNLRKGYRLAGIAAGYVTRYLEPTDGPLLDAGCGTGLVGEALAIYGYQAIDGCDLSPEMLAVAQGRGCYRDLAVQELGRPIPVPDGHYAAFTCFGSFGPGHAPPESLDELVRVIRPGGHGIFNVRSDTYEEQGFARKLEDLSSAGAWLLVEASPDFRPYLLGEPDLLVKAFVYRKS